LNWGHTFLIILWKVSKNPIEEKTYWFIDVQNICTAKPLYNGNARYQLIFEKSHFRYEGVSVTRRLKYTGHRLCGTVVVFRREEISVLRESVIRTFYCITIYNVIRRKYLINRYRYNVQFIVQCTMYNIL